MIRGLYTAASGMIYENKRQENIAQNIANIQTPGFKQSYISAISQDKLISNRNGKNELGSMSLKVSIDQQILSLAQGDLITSDQSLDFAIEGNGFFTLQGPNGNLYTRDGRFHIDVTGTLVSQDGYPVLVRDDKGNQQTIKVNGDISVSQTGTFNVANINYQFVISNLTNVDQMAYQGDSTFTYNGVAQIQDGDYTIHQNMIESANVNATDALVQMIAVNRSLQTNSKVLTTIDETLKSSVSEIGRV
ncbi:flagellar hook-basal body protein [Turicibacter sanguinis]|uniref:flagellar hook-basal body protein n=1 Tax=Turicibacter sanguinis TaxID=154288 RepID=UPI0018A8FF2D|nr:flagellar hook-basal body protein [Turicibacter sanguinis]MDB8551125.1 flagellar hook-basal body protein [Turicibacter sanguinis]